MLNGSPIPAENAIAELGRERVQDVVEHVVVDGIENRVERVPVYYRIVIVVRCSESRADERDENECLLNEQHGDNVDERGREGICRRRGGE